MIPSKYARLFPTICTRVSSISTSLPSSVPRLRLRQRTSNRIPRANSINHSRLFSTDGRTQSSLKTSNDLYVPCNRNVVSANHADSQCHSIAMYISAALPECRGTAAGVRTNAVIRNLQSLGFRVIVATPGKLHQNIQSYVEEYASMGVDIVRVTMNDSGFDSFITKLSTGDYPHHEGNAPLSLSMVVFDRFMVEEQFGWRVRSAAPNVLRVIDTQDLASLRHCRKQSLSPDTPADSESLPSSSSPDSHTISPSDDFPLSLEDPVVLRELAALHRADASLVVSQVEAQLCTRMGLAARWQRDANGQKEHASGDGLPLLPSLPKIWYVPITFPTHPAAASAAPMRSFDDRKDFVFIGTWRHAPNVDTVEYLKYTIYPLIREKFRNIGIPECNIPELHVYGTYATSAHTALHDPSNGFKVMGTASSVERVMPLYKLLLAPIRFGAGVKGKLLDAFRSGTPVVASSVAAEDVWLRPLPLGASDPSLVDWAVETQPPFGGVVSDDAEAFAQHVVELYFDESRWSAAADSAVKTISARYTDDIAVECLRDMLTTIGYSDAPAPSSSQPHVASQSPLLPDAAKVARLRGRDYTGQVLWQQQLRSTQFMGQMMEQKQRTRMDAQKSVKNQQ